MMLSLCLLARVWVEGFLPVVHMFLSVLSLRGDSMSGNKKTSAMRLLYHPGAGIFEIITRL